MEWTSSRWMPWLPVDLFGLSRSVGGRLAAPEHLKAVGSRSNTLVGSFKCRLPGVKLRQRNFSNARMRQTKSAVCSTSRKKMMAGPKLCSCPLFCGIARRSLFPKGATSTHEERTSIFGTRFLRFQLQEGSSNEDLRPATRLNPGLCLLAPRAIDGSMPQVPRSDRPIAQRRSRPIPRMQQRAHAQVDPVPRRES